MNKFDRTILQHSLDTCKDLEQLENEIVPILFSRPSESIKVYMDMKINIMEKAAKFGVKDTTKLIANLYNKFHWPN